MDDYEDGTVQRLRWGRTVDLPHAVVECPSCGQSVYRLTDTPLHPGVPVCEQCSRTCAHCGEPVGDADELLDGVCPRCRARCRCGKTDWEFLEFIDDAEEVCATPLCQDCRDRGAVYVESAMLEALKRRAKP